MRNPHKPNKSQAQSESAGLLTPFPPRFKGRMCITKRWGERTSVLDLYMYMTIMLNPFHPSVERRAGY